MIRIGYMFKTILRISPRYFVRAETIGFSSIFNQFPPAPTVLLRGTARCLQKEKRTKMFYVAEKRKKRSGKGTGYRWDGRIVNLIWMELSFSFSFLCSYFAICGFSMTFLFCRDFRFSLTTNISARNSISMPKIPKIQIVVYEGKNFMFLMNCSLSEWWVGIGVRAWDNFSAYTSYNLVRIIILIIFLINANRCAPDDMTR